MSGLEVNTSESNIEQGNLEEILNEVHEEDLNQYFDQVPAQVIGPLTVIQQNWTEDTPRAAALSQNLLSILAPPDGFEAGGRRISFDEVQDDPKISKEEPASLEEKPVPVGTLRSASDQHEDNNYEVVESADVSVSKVTTTDEHEFVLYGGSSTDLMADLGDATWMMEGVNWMR